MGNYNMFFLLEELRKQSKCLDKQVACIITDRDDNILSVGYNNVQLCSGCTKDGDKSECNVIHAEQMAISNLSKFNSLNKHLTAYLSLYPCPACQEKLEAWVEKVVVFGEKHKECVIHPSMIELRINPIEKLLEINGKTKQLAVIQSEFAEGIKVVSDYFYRNHERDEDIKDVVDEVVDIKLMSSVLIHLLKVGHNIDSIYSDLNAIESSKLHKICQAIKSGKIKPGLPVNF